MHHTTCEICGCKNKILLQNPMKQQKNYVLTTRDGWISPCLPFNQAHLNKAFFVVQK
jgi:hypothetical protein